jgi:hypothetical protein
MNITHHAFETWMERYATSVPPHLELDMNFPQFLKQFTEATAQEKLALLAKAPPMGLLIVKKEVAPWRNAPPMLSHQLIHHTFTNSPSYLDIDPDDLKHFAVVGLDNPDYNGSTEVVVLTPKVFRGSTLKDPVRVPNRETFMRHLNKLADLTPESENNEEGIVFEDFHPPVGGIFLLPPSLVLWMGESLADGPLFAIEQCFKTAAALAETHDDETMAHFTQVFQFLWIQWFKPDIAATLAVDSTLLSFTTLTQKDYKQMTTMLKTLERAHHIVDSARRREALPKDAFTFLVSANHWQSIVCAVAVVALQLLMSSYPRRIH